MLFRSVNPFGACAFDESSVRVGVDPQDVEAVASRRRQEGEPSRPAKPGRLSREEGEFLRFVIVDIDPEELLMATEFLGFVENFEKSPTGYFMGPVGVVTALFGLGHLRGLDLVHQPIDFIGNALDIGRLHGWVRGRRILPLGPSY